jgi:excisionase family DNA binding protein
MPPDFLTTSEAASLLRCSEKSIQRARASGKLPFQKLGSNGVRFRREHVEALLSPATVPPPQRSFIHTRITDDAAELPPAYLRPLRRSAS